MSRKLVVFLAVLTVALAQCPSQNTIADFQTGSYSFLSSNVQGQLTTNQPITQQFRHTPSVAFNKLPQVCIGINGMETKSLNGNSFVVRSTFLANNFMELTASYSSNIWNRIQVTFLLSSRDDVIIGTLIRGTSFTELDFSSLKGMTTSLAFDLPKNLTNPANAISRIFLNGYALNSPSTQVEIYLSQNSITNNLLTVNVLTGNSFDLKTIYLSFVVYTPNNVPFGSFGEIFNKQNFQSSFSKNIIQNIGYLKYSLFGIMSLKMSQTTTLFSFSSEIDQDFIYTQSSTSKIDLVSTAYVVFGITSSKACFNCRQNIENGNTCVSTCPSGILEKKFADGGASCLRCSSKLNQKLNSNKSACQCIDGHQFSAQSGRCEIIRQAGTQRLGSNLNSIESVKKEIINQNINKGQFSQNFTPIGPQNCGSDRYWSGSSCICNPNFLEINNICIHLSQALLSDFIYQVPIFIYDQTNSPNPKNCQTGEYFNLNIAKCQCLPGLGKFQGICQVCPQNYFLTSAGECISCPANMQFNQQSQICQCKANFIDQNGVCKCPSGFIQSGANCIPLIGSCLPNQIRLPNGSCSNCPANQTPENNSCVCRPGYIRGNGICVLNTTNCSEIQYPTDKGCEDCPNFSRFNSLSKQCKCILGYNKIVIRPGLFFCVNIVKSNCTQGKYFDLNQQVCKDCHSTCRRCADGAGQCLECKNANHLISGKQCNEKTNPPTPPITVETCGNGILNGAIDNITVEECDDGNAKDLDGCSSKCKFEAGFICNNTMSRPTTVCFPQISISLSEEPKSNQQNVFVNFRIYPVFNFANREQERNFLRFTFPIISTTPQTISCFRKEPIDRPEIFNCLLSYPSGKPVNIFSITTSWSREQKNATITFPVDPNQSINILNTIQ